MAFRSTCVSRRCGRRWLEEVANTASLEEETLIKFRDRFEIGDDRYLPYSENCVVYNYRNRLDGCFQYQQFRFLERAAGPRHVPLIASSRTQKKANAMTSMISSHCGARR
jgi:hypothetical protein